MISVILTLAVSGLIVYLATTYIPMPDVFKRAIYIVAVVCLLVYLLGVFGIVDVPLPHLR